MAETDASLAIENAVQQLEKAPEILGKMHKLKSLKKSLKDVSMSLKEFDGQEYEPRVADWLKYVKDIAYDSQDLIGSIVVNTNLQKHWSKLRRLVSEGRITRHHEEEIEKMDKRIHKISSFKNNDSGPFKEPCHNGHAQPEMDDAVGFKVPQETLATHLIVRDRPQLEFIFVCGKPGSGKTTLTKMVYNDARVDEHFERRVWVHLSQELPFEELLWKILKHTSPSSSSNQTDCVLDEDELKAKLSASLQGKRYLVVIDGICKYNDAFDEQLISSFPDELNGSRILLTSSSLRPAALDARCSLLYKIKPLDASQSWELLSRKIFEGEICPTDLESLGKAMATKCEGSPRALVALAAILNHAEKTERMWSKILQDSNQSEDPSKYRDLPEELQLCFLYFGLFPVDSNIPAKQMIRLWTAEGLAKQRGSRGAEDIGEDNLEELIRRSFIQVDSRRPNGSVKKCRVLTNVSHFCTSEGESREIFEVKMNNFSRPQKKIRRLAIHSDSLVEVWKSFENCTHVHSLHFFGNTINSISIRSTDFWGTLYRNFPNLNILNMGSLEIDRVPKVLGKLKLLKYLRLRAPNATRLPSSIENLQQLETLDMRESHQLSVPHGIWNIESLRHLYLGKFMIPHTLGMQYYKALPNLQTLSGVQPDNVLRWLMVRAKFPNVKKMRICSLDRDATFKFLNSLDHLNHLQTLRIENPIKLPDQHAFPLTLTKLTLLETKLPSECIKTLERLSNLRILKLLQEAICGEEIKCSARGFSQLEYLYMVNLALQKLTGNEAMRNLKHLLIKECTHLETIPDHLTQVAIIDKELTHEKTLEFAT